MDTSVRSSVATTNACNLCAPLGACMVFRGISGCIPLIHGSQGCATYIRRYGISHFREPLDIASSNFSETTAIFGGKINLFTALDNVSRSYNPSVIGIASTCLSETIGENVDMYVKQYLVQRESGSCDNGGHMPEILFAPTPSYRGTHMDGFHEAIRSVVVSLVGEKPATSHTGRINVISGFVSTEDLRELHTILQSFGSDYTLLPDYSESLDGPSWETYHKLPEGGTSLEHIRAMGSAAGTIYFGFPTQNHAGDWLQTMHQVPVHPMDLPIGIENTDRFLAGLSELTNQPVPEALERQRGRLVDAYIDGHKYVNGKRVVVYGEADLVVALTSFLDEIGIIPTVIATGEPNRNFSERITGALRNRRHDPVLLDDTDFTAILAAAKDAGCDFVMGNSKGLYLARNLGVPLIRCGFPIHDRLGAQRILHLGYRGALNLFDLVCNTILATTQDLHDTGYTYM